MEMGKVEGIIIHGRRRVNFGAEINSKEGGKKVSHCRLKPTAFCRHDAGVKPAPLRARSEPKSLGGSLSLPDKIITQPKGGDRAHSPVA
jgi:hypothetical protein